MVHSYDENEIGERILKVIRSGKINNFHCDILSEILGKSCEYNIRRALQNLVREGKIIPEIIIVNQWRNKIIYKLSQ